MSQVIAILGAAGTIGKGATPELLKRGYTVRAVGRDRLKLERAFRGSAANIVTADVATMDGCIQALQGAESAIYAIGLPYFKTSFALYPPMMKTFLEAARQTGLEKMILVTNVYPYGRPQAARVREDHPRVPCSVKGEYRKQQEDIALAAHRQGELDVVTLRLPDFYSADAELSLAWLMFSAAAAGKKANLLGPVETPHQFFYTPDIGPVIAELLVRPDLFGTGYNVAGDETISIHEFARRVYLEFGMEKPKYFAAGRTVLSLMGLFSPPLRELKEMAYLQETPVILDGSTLRSAIPRLVYMSYDEGIKATVRNMQAAALLR